MALDRIGSEGNSTTLGGSLTVLSDGTLLKVFSSDDAMKLYGQIYTAEGTSIGAQFLIQSVTSGGLMLSSATALSNGRFAVSWMHDLDSLGDYRLQTRIVSAGGASMGPVVHMADGLSSYGEMVSLAGGGFAMTYRGGGIKSVVFSDAGAMGTPFGLEGAFDFVIDYEVASLTGGGFVNAIEVSGSDGARPEVKAILHRPNGSLTTIDVAPAGQLGDVDVVGLANGNFIVAWREGLGAGNALKAKIFNAEGAAVGGPFTLYQDAAVTIEGPSIEPLINGGFALAFTGVKAADRDVYLGTFSGTGAAVDAPAVVGEHTTGEQQGPGMTVLKDGRLLFRWADWSHWNEDQVVGYMYQMFDPRTEGVSITGGSTGDRYVGSKYGDTLDGGGGADTLSGGAGNDTFYVDNTGDRVIETSTGGAADRVYSRISYTLSAYVENVIGTGSRAISLTGNGLANTVTGNVSKNTLKGGAGNDKLNGAKGNDVLYGGSGKDIFVFSTSLSSKYNKDRIMDWNKTYDTIQLENGVFKALKKTGTLSKSFFKLGAAAGDSNDYIGYNKATGDLWYDSNGNKAGGQVVFANIGKDKAIAYNDFIVI